MNKRIGGYGILLALLGVFAINSPAHAVLITIEPDQFASGTDISHATPGVTLATAFMPSGSAEYDPAYSSVYSVRCDDCPVPTGSSMFTHSAEFEGRAWYNADYADRCYRGITPYCGDGFRLLQATFHSPTSFVSFETHWLSDPVSLYAYNSSGELVASCLMYAACSYQWSWENVNGANFATMSIQRDEADIAWVLAGGDDSSAGIDRMVFESVSVPTPGTLGLLLCGLLGLAAKRRSGGTTLVGLRRKRAA